MGIISKISEKLSKLNESGAEGFIVTNKDVTLKVFPCINEKPIRSFKDEEIDEFFYSIEQEDFTTVEKFLKNGMDPNIKLYRGVTPIIVAIINNKETKILDILIKSGADVDGDSRFMSGFIRTPLEFAIREHNRDAFMVLLHAGASVNMTHNSDHSPLHVAVFIGDPWFIRHLISAGADTNAKDYYEKETPLHLAAQIPDDHIIKMLIHSGADISLKNRKGDTPLDIYKQVRGNNPETLKLLDPTN